MAPDQPEQGAGSEALLAVYERCLARGHFDESHLTDALDLVPDELAALRDRLVDLGLLRVDDPGGALTPVGPHVAETLLVYPLENAIRNQQQQLEFVRRRLREATEKLLEAQRIDRSEQTVVTVEDPAEVQLHLQEASWRCRSEVCTMQPGGAREKRTLAEALPRDLEMLRQGVRMRIIYQHTARSSMATMAYARQIVDAGGEIRTRDEVLARLIIFDRATAFVPRPSGGPPGAAIVHDPSVVGFLQAIYDRAWSSAMPLRFDDSGEEDDITDTVRAPILKLMARGLKDEAVARQLGMSPRTCRRHMAKIMDELGAVSRFQAGVVAATSGFLADEPSAAGED